MFRIENNKIELTRGDSVDFTFSIPGYTFKVGDIVSFRVYNRKALNKDPLLVKNIHVDKASDKIWINLSNKDTKIGEMVNEKTIYWYEVSLNDEFTAIGFDNNGGKEILLYPEGKSEDDE